MADENGMPDVTGQIESITSSNIMTKAGRSLNKFEISVGGTKYSGIGATPKVAQGDTVTLKLKANGTFINVVDVIKGGVSLMPKFRGGGAAGGMSTKALMVLAATMVAVHNAKDTPITPADIQGLLPELIKMAAD